MKVVNYNIHEQFERFILFGNYHHYPNGGLKDARATANTLAELLYWQVEQGQRFDYNEWHIFDTKEMKVIKEG